MSKDTSSGSGRISFVGLLTIVFITLKLLGKIDWSWALVLSPIWISILCVLSIIVLLLIAAVLKVWSES